jgi:hypothetical protein
MYSQNFNVPPGSKYAYAIPRAITPTIPREMIDEKPVEYESLKSKRPKSIEFTDKGSIASIKNTSVDRPVLYENLGTREGFNISTSTISLICLVILLYFIDLTFREYIVQIPQNYKFFVMILLVVLLLYFKW